MIQIGQKVNYLGRDGPKLGGWYGPAVVLAIDGDWPDDQPFPNRPTAWIRYTTEQGAYLYRSVDQEDLEPAPSDKPQNRTEHG